MITTDNPGGESTFPLVKHRPRTATGPADTKLLAAARRALLDNPDVNLSSDAAGVVTAGLADPVRFTMLVKPDDRLGETTSLLIEKRVGEGSVFITQQHDRFLELGTLPDIQGARWLHLVRNRLHDEPGLPAAVLGTGADDGRYRAMIELRVADRAEFTDRIFEAFVKTTPDGPSVRNDYTDSILQSGVKEPLMLVVMRVVFDDGTDDEYYLVAVDGNSRLVSSWKARTGGTVEQAAAACIEAVVGTGTGRGFRRVTQRAARSVITDHAELVNRGLNDDPLTEATIRLGQTLTVPAVVVVGGWAGRQRGNPLTDLIAARDDLIGTIHTDATPWDDEARAGRGLVRVLRRAVLEAGVIDDDTRQVIEGRFTVEEMHDRLGLPPNRLWATALTVQAILNGWDKGVFKLFAEQFLNRRPTRMVIGKQIATTALSAYKTEPFYAVARNTFGDGGPITDLAWKTPWSLTPGDDVQETLDAILARALDGESSAIAELSVLGGTAAILLTLLTRDRGSKRTETGIRDQRKVPYRARPDRVIANLAGTIGGLRILHSLASSLTNRTRGNPKLFWTETDPEGTYADGDPVLDNADAQVSIDYEWDLFTAASPADTRTALGEIADTRPDDERPREPAAVTARTLLLTSAAGFADAVTELVHLSASQGTDVFGDPAKVEQIMTKVQKALNRLHRHAPEPDTVRIDIDDRDERED
jgi:hypothetical protein